MNQLLSWGSKDRVVDEAEKMGPVDNLKTWCYITLSFLRGVSGHSSWSIRDNLTETFVVSGLSSSFYRSWKMP